MYLISFRSTLSKYAVTTKKTLSVVLETPEKRECKRTVGYHRQKKKLDYHHTKITSKPNTSSWMLWIIRIVWVYLSKRKSWFDLKLWNRSSKKGNNRESTSTNFTMVVKSCIILILFYPPLVILALQRDTPKKQDSLFNVLSEKSLENALVFKKINKTVIKSVTHINENYDRTHQHRSRYLTNPYRKSIKCNYGCSMLSSSIRRMGYHKTV